MDTNEVSLNKRSVAEIHERSSCRFCHYILWSSSTASHSDTCRCHHKAHKEEVKSECTVPTTIGVLDKQKGLLHRKEPHGVKVEEEYHWSGRKEIGKNRAEECFLGSSVHYGGPDEFYDFPQGKKENPSEIKMAVQQLESAMDPFHNEYATRGNWWEGSLYY